MKGIEAVNEFVIRFANVNGTGSASANAMFAKSLFRMGIPSSPKNIFPSNIQGLPTWFEVRVSEQGYLGRRGGVDIAVAVNPQSMAQDIADLNPGGYLVYDNTKALDVRLHRDDIHLIGLPLTDLCRQEYSEARQRQLFKNVIYVGALAALLNIEFSVLKELVGEQFKGKDKLIASNIHALELGFQYAQKNFQCPLTVHLESRDLIGDKIIMEGNDALALGAVYGGATVVAWYPLTPSTSVIEGFEKYAKRLRIDPGSGDRRYAVAQAEDELAAIGIVIGAGWNGARSFTATSGPGLSLMSEFLGLAYFAEVPAVLFDIQRAGPSTGMPTRTQQSDIFAAAYASHGDTKHILLIPSDPKECFEMAAESFDLADRFQTPVILMSDLDLGMNDHLCEPLEWDDQRNYDRGKVFSNEDLENMSERYGRYLDIDDDGICYRTLPGVHPEKGAFFTRGTSRNEYAVYTEFGDAYVNNVDRLNKKFETAKDLLPLPEFHEAKKTSRDAVIFYGSSNSACLEALDILAADGLHLNGMRLRSFPFNKQVTEFVNNHDRVFVIEQNRDGQMRKLLIIECELDPQKLLSYTHYDGMPMTARGAASHIASVLGGSSNVTPLRKKKAGEKV
jgi:2-oxoglutarate ferredoxin oxidoreductase subunit alpha